MVVCCCTSMRHAHGRVLCNRQCLFCRLSDRLVRANTLMWCMMQRISDAGPRVHRVLDALQDKQLYKQSLGPEVGALEQLTRVGGRSFTRCGYGQAPQLKG